MTSNHVIVDELAQKSKIKWIYVICRKNKKKKTNGKKALKFEKQVPFDETKASLQAKINFYAYPSKHLAIFAQIRHW